MINVMQANIVEKAGNQNRLQTHLKMVVQSGETVICMACTGRIQAAIGDVMIEAPVSLFADGDQEFILGQLYATEAKLASEKQDYVMNLCMIFSQDRKWELSFTAYRSSLKDIKCADDIWISGKVN